MGQDYYNYEERNRRRRQRNRRARRQRIVGVLALVLALLLVGGALWWFVLREKEPTGGETPPITDPVTDPVTDPATDPVKKPELDRKNLPWSLILVNPWNSIPEGYDMDLSYMYDGYSRVDSRCYEDLDDMIDALYAEDLVPVICSSYRTTDVQQSLFDGQIDYFVNQGMSWEDARVAAAREVAVPGTSEHQLGLAVDIVDVNYQWLDEGQEDTPVQQWLLENSWRYGFILRYPNDKTHMTGIIYEPWHYRYVGKEYAEDIYNSGLCLEEWLYVKCSPQ